MGFLYKYWKEYWKPFCVSIAFLLVEAFVDLMQPTLMSKIIDVGVAGKDLHFVFATGGLMLGITAVGAIGACTRNIVSCNVSNRFGAHLRADLFKKIQNLSFDNIDRFNAASLVMRLTNDVSQVQNFVFGMMRIMVKAPILCIGSLIMATLLNPPMALVFALVVPVVGLLIYFSMRIGYPRFMLVQKALDRVNSVMREYLSGVRVVKAFNKFEYETNRFEDANGKLSDASIGAMRIMAIFSPSISLAVNLAIAVVLWIGGYRVDNGGMKVGQIIAFINYMTQVLQSLMMITMVFNTFVRARASAERIGEVFAEENTMKATADPVGLSDGKGLVEFEQVSFKYKDAAGKPVLKDITFACSPGETLGIIGSTGSGKSSLVNLIPRFYDPLSGSVKVDGIDVRALELKQLREKIAVVPQKTVLFSGTIMENIKWGREEADGTEIGKASAIAQAHSFITAFPEGYDTFLGQGGINLSGGQKQRIAIARALARKPEILILDDCTSAVDVTTEAEIRKGLREYLKNLTCIIIAQRITSVMWADRILVLDNGEIVGLGTHKELMEACGVYKDIYHSQIGGEGL